MLWKELALGLWRQYGYRQLLQYEALSSIPIMLNTFFHNLQRKRYYPKALTSTRRHDSCSFASTTVITAAMETSRTSGIRTGGHTAYKWGGTDGGDYRAPQPAHRSLCPARHAFLCSRR